MLTYTEYTQGGWRLHAAEGYAELFAPRPGSVYAAHARVLVRWVEAGLKEENRAQIREAQRP